MEICKCGDRLRSHEVKAGRQFECGGCGCRYLRPNQDPDNPKMGMIQPPMGTVFFDQSKSDRPPWED